MVRFFKELVTVATLYEDDILPFFLGLPFLPWRSVNFSGMSLPDLGVLQYFKKMLPSIAIPRR
jgi:hypothetical protein